MKSLDTVKQELATANKGFIAKFNAGDAAGVAAIELITAEVDADDETAIEYGRYVMKTADGTVADEDNFLVHCKKQDGAWRLHRDSITTDVAAG